MAVGQGSEPAGERKLLFRGRRSDDFLCGWDKCV